jgi:crotonobetainyl-CoA:carnitine CoA-transferase CaiB-like acyl-CoA transferase
MAPLPLQDVRIVDVCQFLAGPYAVQLLASLGAEVIKIESIQRLDNLRLMGGYPQPDGYEWSAAFNTVNVNKYSVTLDLNHPRGKDIFKKLVKASDVVTNNFSSRVMENLSLSYEVLREVNPQIIMLSMPGYGTTGPWRNYVAMGPNIEMLAGTAMVSGYPNGSPMLNGYIADPFASLAGAVAVMVALKHRQRTGRGQHVDLSHVEAITSFNAQPIMDYVMNRRIQPRRGNRHQSIAPQGVYRCKGEDEWVAIAVSSEEEWANLCDAMDNPSWVREPKFSDPITRYSNHDRLDKLIEAWTSQRDKNEVMQILQRAGVAAASVLASSELVSDPHLGQREFIQEVTHPVTGTYKQQGFPVKFSETPVRIRIPAPTLGQHNEYVLTELLGLTAEELRQLAEEKVIGTKPMGWPYSEEAGEQDKRLLVGDQGSGVREALEKRKGIDGEETAGK